jgi:hypothetical protein
LGVCGKGLQRTAWEPLADLGCAANSTCDVVGKVQWRISTLTILANCSVLIFRIEYLENADQALQAEMMHPEVAPSPASFVPRMLRFVHPESATTNQRKRTFRSQAFGEISRADQTARDAPSTARAAAIVRRARRRSTFTRIATARPAGRPNGGPSRARHHPRTLDELGVSHCQQLKGRFETGQRLHSFSPSGRVGPALQVELADFSKGYISKAAYVCNGRFSRTEVVAMNEIGVQDRQRGLGTSA